LKIYLLLLETLLIQGVVSEDGAYVLGIPGFLTEEEMHETLKVNSTLTDIIALLCWWLGAVAVVLAVIFILLS